MFAIAKRVESTLRKAGMQEKAFEVRQKLFQCRSLEEAKKLFEEYVEK
jgi:hypothetical protein